MKKFLLFLIVLVIAINCGPWVAIGWVIVFGIAAAIFGRSNDA